MEFITPSLDTYTIYCKSGCPYCEKTKLLLNNNISSNFLKPFIVDCDEYLLKDKENFLIFIEKIANVPYRFFPIVFYKGEFIGGYNETIKHFQQNTLTFTLDEMEDSF
jgi:glutaredoxin